jgi:hypothetical protein
MWVIINMINNPGIYFRLLFTRSGLVHGKESVSDLDTDSTTVGFTPSWYLLFGRIPKTMLLIPWRVLEVYVHT